MNHYETLGVGPKASLHEIHEAYLGLARRNHPDLFVTSDPHERARAEERMREINEAWNVLSVPSSRDTYDESMGMNVSVNTPFVPFDDGEDDPDPLMVPDVPYRIEPDEILARRSFVNALPIFAVLLGVMMTFAAFLIDVFFLLQVAVVIFGAAAAGFIAVPLLALNRSKRDEG